MVQCWIFAKYVPSVALESRHLMERCTSSLLSNGFRTIGKYLECEVELLVEARLSVRGDFWALSVKILVFPSGSMS